ncbi:peptide deformylase [Pseudonocardia sp. CNS-139]|nr:peptide deformylase [Pseudonocardia sp. CNS-139]
MRPLRLVGDPVLRTPCAPVTAFDAGLSALVDDLLDSVRRPGRAGLAANQIGVSLAAFSYNLEGRLGYVVNPRLVATDGEYDGEEACLSVPGVHAPRLRAMFARVEGVDRRGRPVAVEGTGELARCLQHETDHLRGELYIDGLAGERRRAAMRMLREAQESGVDRDLGHAGPYRRHRVQ